MPVYLGCVVQSLVLGPLPVPGCTMWRLEFVTVPETHLLFTPSPPLLLLWLCHCGWGCFRCGFWLLYVTLACQDGYTSECGVEKTRIKRVYYKKFVHSAGDGETSGRDKRWAVRRWHRRINRPAANDRCMESATGLVKRACCVCRFPCSDWGEREQRHTHTHKRREIKNVLTPFPARGRRCRCSRWRFIIWCFKLCDTHNSRSWC